MDVFFQDYSVESVAETTSQTFRIDFDSGRIVGFIDGLEAVQQAIYMILNSERFVHCIFSWDYGHEMRNAFGRDYDVFESEMRRTIREALLQDERIVDIEDFEVQQTGAKSARVSFAVDTVFGGLAVEQEVLL